MNREAARELHLQSKPYTVVIGSIDNPFCFIEVGKVPCLVVYLQGLKRWRRSCHWKQIDQQTLFLIQILDIEGIDDTDTTRLTSTYQFSEDGNVTVYKEQVATHETETITGKVEVSDFYTRIPTFGEYDDLVRHRRIEIRTK